MRIVFILVGTENRPKILNGDTIRYGEAASSGTDQSVILISEYLSSKGYDVTIVLDKTNKKICRGVKYTDFTYDGLTNTTVDILVTMLWFDGYDSLPFKVSKSLVYWYHLAWVYSMDSIISFCKLNDLKIGLVNVSKWAQLQNKNNIDSAKNNLEFVIDSIIPNPIMIDFIEELKEDYKIEKKERTSIFHAQYSRGGEVADRVISKLGWPKMFTFDYTNLDNGVDKKTLFKKLLETDYFIFPLVSSNGCVYKDTFSCSVAEALASNVIVVTYPLGAFPEYYSESIIFSNFPNGIDLQKMLTERVTCEATNMNTIDTIVEKIIELENNLDNKYNIRNNSSNLIKDRFTIRSVGKFWEDLIHKLI